MSINRRNSTAVLLASVAMILAGCEIRNRSEGDSCACSEQCAEGLYCTEHTQPSEVDGTCGEGSGVCTSYAVKGDRCSSDGSRAPECAPGLVCLSLEHVCGDRLSEGRACDPQASFQCSSGLTCNAALEPAQCRAPGKAGEPCAASFDCLDPLTCNLGFDPGRCEPAGSSGDGQPCSEDEQCSSPLICNTAMAAPICITPWSGATAADCNADIQCASHHCNTWSDGQTGYWIGKCS